MAGRTLLYGGAAAGASVVNPVLFQNQRVSCSSSEPHESIFTSASSTFFLGPRSMVSFEDVKGGKRSERLFYHSFDQDENGDEELDYLRQPEKKRRLMVEQVQFLEKSFELENKLEPERKVELAKELGLQPRQVAIWFQNRRARWKSKQLEKDYDELQSSYNNLKADYENLLKEKDNLKAEVARISDKLFLKGKENGKVYYGSDFSAVPVKEPSTDSVSEDEVSKVSAPALKPEDLSSAKSDVFDSDSPYCRNDGVHSSLLERGNASYVFEHELDNSDLSQDEEDNITKNLSRPACGFSKIEDTCYSDPPSSGYFIFPAEDQAFGFWSL